ncbi:bifunctional UDP-N-acetylglucosamine diphosphorylase/glucosamine-1-phosphate N-acetyltransferase GlmU [Sphingomicrobium astaxanthinifaciens]|uniref:bifunctional UDP-N-acetylglucosamine diphosphorylase/glucosamine-1-phosphate N-acetyltransferase GlmU n=1 Tax=Sphingomicrobium astaxanthinifaciens TaxID=1227949 RepID=UPI001FCAAB4B|nr:bifunctional UDP-N-acetylglucosamine diphosphorylase/glucosamine-1-phosphate N-acetyltransferase GlmU [Sphingomicrobium astaxanthinifaciens]MCJ7421967.1 bifunctional UDP-N-acetylglucosamine diphosphorylase/glucosamine-1-phosphate N-acetyltransferase GlmU [Sphingomicrobium astaxanthinifaciens]
MNQSPAIIVLAAGKGTRMKSALHKVLHPIAGRPMIEHLLGSVDQLSASRTVVVVGQWKEQLEAALDGRGLTFAEQTEQLGTGHAVQQAQAALAGHVGPVILLFGDVPMVRAETMRAMVERLEADDKPGIVALGFEPEDTKAYGRIITMGDDRIDKMVEHKDASPEERRCRMCNSGMMAVEGASLFDWLAEVDNDNAAGEYYLPDIVNIAKREGRRPVVVKGEEREVTGINSRAEMAQAEAQWQAFKREEAMAAGVTLRAPETVFFSWDTELGADVTIEPFVQFGPGVRVADGATIRAHSHLEGCDVGEGCEVGPYARLRPGARLERGAKVGNFVEIKNAVLGAGAKANHLTYVGDAAIGPRANLGAGTITCNYDGFNKWPTIVGADAFVGSNSALVAPVVIGERAIVGAGSVVTKDVTADAIAIARGQQKELAGAAKSFRDKAGEQKKAGVGKRQVAAALESKEDQK